MRAPHCQRRRASVQTRGTRSMCVAAADSGTAVLRVFSSNNDAIFSCCAGIYCECGSVRDTGG